MNLEMVGADTVKIGFCATAARRDATVQLKAGRLSLLRERVAISPGKPYLKEVHLPPGTDPHTLRASLSADKKELVAYSPVRLAPIKMPEPVTPPPPADEIKTVEELYLAGRRIEQFHAPGQEPEPYWDEALRRDPQDARVNIAVGIRKLKQARFVEAEEHLQRALKRLAASYTTPKEGEPYYYLGLAQQAQGREDEAVDNFSRASWSEAWRGPANYALAETACRRGDFLGSLVYLDRSLEANALNLPALTLKAAVLRHLGRTKEALAVLADAAEKTDPLDVRLMAERRLAGGKTDATQLAQALRSFPNAGLEAAVEDGNAGLWRDGIDLLELMLGQAPHKSERQPLACYYLAYFAERLGDAPKAADYRRLARSANPDYAFPFQWESIAALRAAMAADPQDARAPYYLGNLFYDWQPAEATRLWEKSAELDSSFPLVRRNLAVAYSHAGCSNSLALAIAQLERAVAGSEKFALHFTELDELYAAAGIASQTRLARLEQDQAVVAKRDDALSREIGLKIFASKYDDAIQLMTGRQFAVWEGGSLDVADHWVQAHLLRGRQELAAGRPTEALADFARAKSIPENLPSDQRSGGRAAEIAYWVGAADDLQGNTARAKESWREAANAGPGDRPRRGPADRLSERQVQSCFQALAQRKLGQTAEAETIFRGLLEAATKALSPDPVSKEISNRPPEVAANRARVALAHYVAGLAQAGLGDKQKATAEFEQALQSAPDFSPAKVELESIRQRP